VAHVAGMLATVARRGGSQPLHGASVRCCHAHAATDKEAREYGPTGQQHASCSTASLPETVCTGQPVANTVGVSEQVAASSRHS